MTQVDELARLRRDRDRLRAALKALLAAATAPYMGQKLPPDLQSAAQQAQETLREVGQ